MFVDIVVEVNGLEEGEKPILRRSNRRSIAQNAGKILIMVLSCDAR